MSSNVEDLGTFFDKFISGAAEVSINHVFLVSFFLQNEKYLLKMYVIFFLAKPDNH